MRLFIDDERSPLQYLKDWQAGTAWDVWSKTSDEAIKFLEWWFNGDHDYPVEMTIFLDHDLGGYDTTMPVVDWLTRAKFEGRVNPDFITCVIHTQNPVGRNNIRRTLQRWGFKTLEAHL